MNPKKAVLVVSFGTSHHDTLEKTIHAIESSIASAFPNHEVRRAFTSGMIVRKLAKRDGVPVDRVPEALTRLADDGFSEVYIQPTHMIHGFEYENVVSIAEQFKSSFNVLKVGKPVLSASDDYRRLVEIIVAAYPLAENEGMVLMGHGTAHFSNASYPALDYMFRVAGVSDVHIGTVEGFPEIDVVLEMIRPFRYKKIFLAPLMVVAGDHAKNDMAGDDDDSWKTIFEGAGYRVEVILKGLGELPEFHTLLIDHLKEAMEGHL